MIYRKVIKRIIDFFVSLVAFVCLLPIFLTVAILLAINHGGSPFFLQRRPGKYGVIFWIIKFKTMNDKKDGQGMLLPDSDRLTKLGLFVRKTSLDEIPQLLNVLNGDMSLIGPRPLLPEYLPLYNKFQEKRHEIRPGITGWAQINGRNAISWDEKFKFDVWYVDNVNFWLDLKIMFLTLKKIIIRDGISSGTSATMEKFIGN